MDDLESQEWLHFTLQSQLSSWAQLLPHKVTRAGSNGRHPRAMMWSKYDSARYRNLTTTLPWYIIRRPWSFPNHLFQISLRRKMAATGSHNQSMLKWADQTSPWLNHWMNDLHVVEAETRHSHLGCYQQRMRHLERTTLDLLPSASHLAPISAGEQRRCLHETDVCFFLFLAVSMDDFKLTLRTAQHDH